MTCIGLLQLTFDYLDTSLPGMSSSWSAATMSP